MKQYWRQLVIFCVPVILSLWVMVACSQSRTSDPVAFAQEPDPSRREVGADTGTVKAVAYSGENGDAYVRIEGDTVYAEARLNGSIIDPTSTATLQPTQPAPTPTPLIVNTPILAPTEALVTITAKAAANVRAAPWGAILGAVGPGESFTANGVAQPWYRITWHGQEAWIHGDLVDVSGNTATLPIVSISVAQPVAVAPTAAPPPDPPMDAAPGYQFIASVPLLQTEANNPAFYFQIEQNQNPAPGRWCVVFHNGTEVGRAQSVNVFDTANKGTPWTDDDRPYNCEVKFFDGNPQTWTGTWVVEVQDGAGSVIGRTDPFVLTQTEQQVWILFFGT
jgi:hypothetical protein